MGVDLVIGCPTRKRDWILDIWKEAVLLSLPEGVSYKFCFITGEDDIKTIDKLNSWTNEPVVIKTVIEEATEDIRSWSDPDRYHHMAFLRNKLLSTVAQEDPKYFLSLDSDILIHPNLISNLTRSIEVNDFDAVGGLTFLDPVNKDCTNVAMWTDQKMQGFKRVKSIGVHKVDAIMAIKLIKGSALKVGYSYHPMGEDFGWCKNMKYNDKKIGYDGRVPNKHVMHPKWLGIVDKRVGW